MLANREVIERSLCDMEFYYRQFYHRLNNLAMDELVVGEPSDRQKKHERLGRNAMNLWAETLMSCIASIVPGCYRDEYMLAQLEIDEFVNLIYRYMDDALDLGIDCKLEALYAGVPYEDIVA